MSKFCAKCGNQLEGDARFCENCGSKVEGVGGASPPSQTYVQTPQANVQSPQTYAQSPSQKPKSNTKKVLAIILGIFGLFVILTIAGIFFLISKKDDITKKVQDTVTEKITDELGLEEDFSMDDWTLDEKIVEDIADDFINQFEDELPSDSNQIIEDNTSADFAVDDDQIIEDNTYADIVTDNEEYYGDGFIDASVFPVEIIEGYWDAYLEEYYLEELVEEAPIEFYVNTENGEVTSVTLIYRGEEELDISESMVEVSAFYEEGMLYFYSDDMAIEFFMYFFEDESGIYGYGTSNELDGYIRDITVWR